jgi:hypothetical protein
LQEQNPPVGSFVTLLSFETIIAFWAKAGWKP